MKLATIGAGGSGQLPPDGASPDVFSHGGYRVRQFTLGKELASHATGLNAIGGYQRVPENMKNSAMQVREEEAEGEETAASARGRGKGRNGPE